MSKWEKLEMESKILKILEEVDQKKSDHHYGTPFISAYQLAIELYTNNPDLEAELELKVGGVGTGEHQSLAQYIARQLSQGIKRGKIHNIEGAFLSGFRLESMGFDEEVASSVVDDPQGLSIFRLKTN